MTNSLSRRRVLQSNLREFMDKVLLEPPMIAYICNKRIDEQYVEYVSQIMAKQDYIRNNLEEDSAPVKELRKPTQAVTGPHFMVASAGA